MLVWCVAHEGRVHGGEERWKFAVLLVGSDKRPGYDGRVADLHFVAMRDEIVEPLSADVFVVGDSCPSGDGLGTLANLAGEYFGDRVVSCGMVATRRSGNSGSAAGCRVFPAGTTTKPWIQWYRLERCWDLLEAREAERGEVYDAVIKLRADATPLPWLPPSEILARTRRRPNVVHAATDRVAQGGFTVTSRLLSRLSAITTRVRRTHVVQTFARSLRGER